MRKYIILTDSCCDFPAEMVEELGLVVQPLSFMMEGKEYFNYPDNREMDPHVFYEKLRGGTLGTTSAVSVGVFQEAMSHIVEDGKDILCISFSSALSTTYQSACIAAQDVMEAHPGSKVLVVDSRCASLGQGLLVSTSPPRKRRKGCLWRSCGTMWRTASSTSATGSPWMTSTTSSGAAGCRQQQPWWVPCCR